MTELPPKWERTPLEDVVALNPKHGSGVPDDLPVSFVPMAAVSDIRGEIETAHVRPYGEIKKGYTHFQSGDVIFAKITPCMENGKIALARQLTNGLACGTTEFHVLRPSPCIKADFLWRFLRQKSFRVDAERSMTGAVGQRRVPTDYLRQAVVPLPPLAEQRRIVAKIDSLSGKSKRAREHLDHIPGLVEKYKQAVLAAAFSGRLTQNWRRSNASSEHAKNLIAARQSSHEFALSNKSLGRDERSAQIAIDEELQEELTQIAHANALPSTWCWSSFGVLFGVYVGATPSRKVTSFWNGSVPWVSSGEVAFCRIKTTHEMITEAGLRQSSTRLHPTGTILLGMIGEGKTRGQAAVLDIAAANNQNCAAIRVSEAGYSPEYVYWYLWSAYSQTRRLGSGNNQPALNKVRIQRMILPIAPPFEAVEIVRRVEHLFKWIDRLATEATSARELVDRLDQTVLAKAFRGELVPQDQNDEPVGAFLERIRADNATLSIEIAKRKKRN